MPVVTEYQNFPAISYNWKSLDAANAPLQINAKLDTWVAACNANAGNATKQITVERDPSSSTGTRVGWLIRFDGGAQPGFIVHFASQIASGNTTGGARCDLLAIDQWTNNTTNDGYGAIGATISSDPGLGWYISGAAAEFFIASSSDATQEFFILGWNMANLSTYRDVLVFFKDADDNWAAIGDDGGSVYGIVQNPQKGLQVVTAIQATPITSPAHLSKLCFISAGTYSGGEDASKRLVYPAHPKLWLVPSSGFGFGGYYTASGRIFYGASQFYWVIEG